jgi:hypothetical protein
MRRWFLVLVFDATDGGISPVRGSAATVRAPSWMLARQTYVRARGLQRDFDTSPTLLCSEIV